MLERITDKLEVREHLQDLRRWSVPLNGNRSRIVARRDYQASMMSDPVADGDVGDVEEPADDGVMVIEGYAAVFDSPSEPIFGMFTEIIQRGAFGGVLASNPEVVQLVNHAGLPYGSTENGTLTLEEQPRGLYFRTILPNNTAGEDLYVLVDDGYVRKNSFAFRVAPGGDFWACECGDPLGPECHCPPDVVIRTITNISELAEVSVVTFPAYPTTSVTVARESEPGGERREQASDEEQLSEAPLADASTQRAASDHATSIRLWLIAHGGTTDESVADRGAGAR